MKTAKISILGSTGSIGRNTLDVVERLAHRFEVVGLAAGRNLDLLLRQVEKFKPKIVSLEREDDAEAFKRGCHDNSLRVVFGQEGAEEIAFFEQNDIIVSAITGINGLRPTFAAAKTGKRLALANKESMVVAGPLIQKTVRKHGGHIIPVDSEHSGVFQCLEKEKKENVKRVILTASGGPFFGLPKEELKQKNMEDALRHPRWKMGKKVTIDSATMMNKGLELIEAKWLFGLDPAQLDVLVHPQSLVHSIVEMRGGSLLAQLSATDMRIPIQYSLTYPQREEALLPLLDLKSVGSLDFYPVDREAFPLIRLAFQALEEEESFSVALNAANEAAVEAFLKQKIEFFEISEIISEAMAGHRLQKIENLDDIFKIDRETKAVARNLILQRL